MFSINHLAGTTFAFNFSKAGLKVQPEWPHVIAACAELVIVPYDHLKKFAAPDGLPCVCHKIACYRSLPFKSQV